MPTTAPSVEDVMAIFQEVVSLPENGGNIPYAKSYAQVGMQRDRLAEAGAVSGGTYEDALRWQCEYVLGNLGTWRGERAREAKAVLRAFADGGQK